MMKRPYKQLSPGKSQMLRLMFADVIAGLRANEPGLDEKWPVMIMIDEFQQMGRQ